MKFAVMARVSGGVTGTREALCKREDGRVLTFESEHAAQAHADYLTKTMNGPYGTASFRYWPVANEGAI